MEHERKDEVTEEQVTFNDYEIWVMAEATREFLLTRLYYGMFKELRDLFDFDSYQRIISATVTTYGRMVMMSTPDDPNDIDREWVERASLSQETWEATTAIELGSSWDDIPPHKWHDEGCGLCNDMKSLPIGAGGVRR